MLDYLTALVILSAAALTVAAGLAIVWWRERDAGAFLWWAGGFCCTGIGLVLVAIGGRLPGYVSTGLANLLLLLAFAGWIWGARHLAGRPKSPAALLPALAWLASVAVPELREVYYLRFALLNGGSAIGYALLCAALWPVREAPRPGSPDLPSRRPMALLLALAGGWSLLIAIAGLWLRPDGLSSFDLAWLDNIVEVLILLVVVIYGVRLVRERTELRLYALAHSDPLTGVLNRRGLAARLEQLRSPEPGQGLALLMFDMDHFKRVNDRFGHEAGDAVLQAFCRRAEAQLRPTDLFGRLGGEEFAAILPVAGPDRARDVAERIRTAMAEAPVAVAGQAVPVTVSVGVAMLPPGRPAMATAFEAADRALYAAKEAGRDRVELAPGTAS